MKKIIIAIMLCMSVISYAKEPARIDAYVPLDKRYQCAQIGRIAKQAAFLRDLGMGERQIKAFLSSKIGSPGVPEDIINLSMHNIGYMLELEGNPDFVGNRVAGLCLEGMIL
jgi:hypothetical protein